jgi:hypothetical protein
MAGSDSTTGRSTGIAMAGLPMKFVPVHIRGRTIAFIG